MITNYLSSTSDVMNILRFICIKQAMSRIKRKTLSSHPQFPLKLEPQKHYFKNQAFNMFNRKLQVKMSIKNLYLIFFNSKN